MTDDLNKEVEEVVEEMKEKISNLSEAAQDTDGKFSKTVSDIKDKTVDVLNSAIAKLEDMVKTAQDPEEMKKAVEFVKTKSQEIYTVSMTKIKEVKESEEFKKTVNDATNFVKEKADKAFDFAKDTYEKAMENEDVKKAANKVSDVLTDTKEKVEEYIARPETQEKIEKAKDKTIDIAEKAVDALKDWLKPNNKD